MHKIIIFVSLIALTCAGILDIQRDNDELFKYSPNDIYTLPEDVDDDKPPTIYNGEIMKAKTELLENINNGKQFKLQLKTQNGIEVQQVGKLKDDKTFVVSGQYSFTGADGKRYKTRYTADEFGYHPKTELDLDIPEAIPSAPVKQNPFKFLAQNLRNPDFFSQPQTASIINTNLQAPAPTPLLEAAGPLRGSGQSGDDYSFQGQNNPDYNTQNGQNGDNYSLQDQYQNQNPNQNQYQNQNQNQYQNQNQNQNLDQDNVDHRLSGYEYAPPTRHYLPAALDETQYNVPSFV